ncbi:MAG: CoA-binding protein [Desulfobacterales bacterium]
MIQTAGTDTDYERIFNPEKIAIIGVSGKGTGFGAGLFAALSMIGYKGEIFLVNPRGGSLAGKQIHKSIEDIPGSFDLAVIAVTAEAVPEALEACRKKGAAAAEILSAGFKELGTEQGIGLEKEIREIAQKGIRVIGPNCFGIYCPKSGLTMLPGADLSRKTGPVAFCSQSGGMAVDFANTGKSIGLAFSKIMSFGNGADLRETELLGYFGQDPETRVINMYIEGVQDGESFFSALKNTASKKPVIVIKGGLSRAGSRAVLSHTASMGGSRVIWQSMLRQANAVQVKDMEEMARTSLAFAGLPQGIYKQICVLGGGGALGVSAADTAEEYGIHIPAFERALSGRIEELLPRPGSSAGNPVDVANPYVKPEILQQVLELAAEDPRIELQILITLFHHYTGKAAWTKKPVKEVTPFEELAQRVEKVVQKTKKPVVVILNNPKRGRDHLDVVETIEEARKVFMDRGIPCFDDLGRALEAIAHVNAYYERKE